MAEPCKGGDTAFGVEPFKDLPLVTAAQEFMRQNDGVRLGLTVPEIAGEIVTAMAQDSVSRGSVNQPKWDLGTFAKALPGPILHIKSEEIDRWLRGLGYAATSRNNMLQSVKRLFKFARRRNYLPKTTARARWPSLRLSPARMALALFRPMTCGPSRHRGRCRAPGHSAENPTNR